MAKCPHCQQSLSLAHTKREVADAPHPTDVERVHRDVEGLLKKEIMYSCPHCDAVLGFGFFFGGLLSHRLE